MIMLWSGSSATIPTGWLLCDGSNSTPDLRNRFVVGATSTYAVGATGGSADAIVVSHNHAITDAGHTHALHSASWGAQQCDGLASSDSIAGRTFTASAYYTNGASGTPFVQAATTGISINSTGSSGTNANLPPYYALCYIMKS